MKKQRWITADTKKLFEAILLLKTQKEAQAFFRDLLTENEIAEFANRFKVARLLTKKKSYITIVKQTGMSSTTIARIQKWLTNGMGGYQNIIQKLSPYHPA